MSLFGNLEPFGDSYLENVWALPALIRSRPIVDFESIRMERGVGITMGIDLACRAAHVASLAGPHLVVAGSELLHPARRPGEVVAGPGLRPGRVDGGDGADPERGACQVVCV